MRLGHLRTCIREAGFQRFLGFTLLLCAFASATSPQGREDEIVANVASGRVIIHVTLEGIVFATIEKPSEANSIAPRVVGIDPGHFGVLLGAAEWQIPAGSDPIFVDKRIPREGKRPSPVERAARPDGLERLDEENADLELIGAAYLEALRSLAGQLHHKIELGPNEPLLELVVVGYAPKDYGPEVWLYEYRMVQEAMRGDFYQTRVLRPRTTQLYPPEKHQPKTVVEIRYPQDSSDIPLAGLFQSNDPVIAHLARSDPKFARVVDRIQAGKANAAKMADAADFLRALVVPLAGKERFAVGTLGERSGLDWLVPPQEPVERAKTQKGDKDRSDEAPTLRPKPKP
jgi:hypothetical protein